jgi:ABC-type dipeptide/oligopeptide/nickel transport system permease subunit
MNNRSDILQRIAPVCAAVCFAILSVRNVELIANCIVSGAGSLALLVLHPGSWPARLPGMLAAGVAEYWIAGAVWCTAPFLLVRKIFSPGHAGTRMSTGAARAVLYGFMFVSLTAPIVSPLPPLAQGNDLQADRFLPPFSSGMRTETATPLPPADGETSPLERTVTAADNALLQTTVTFTHSSDAQPVPRERDGVKQSSCYFVFGTDAVGRDILSRVIYGTRYSLGIGFIVVFLSLSIGSAAGMISGYAGGITDAVVMRIVDVFLSIPSLFLALMLMAIMGQSLTTMVIVLSATGWMGSARLMRGEAASLRQREFIAASRLLGTSHAQILRRHVLPNLLPTMRNAGILQLGSIILAEASLSFLGLGIQSPEPSWGNMIADSMTYGGAAVFPAAVPGIALTVLIISVHIVGEHSR